MSLSVRPATPADAEAMIRIHDAAVRGTAAAFYPPEVLAAWAAQLTEASWELLHQEIANGEGRIDLVAERDSEVVGFGMLTPGRAELRAVYVHPHAGRLGVGSMILAHLEDAARRHGVERLQCDSSLNAEAFYSRHGYVVVSRGVHTLHGGHDMKSVKMVKELRLVVAAE